MELTLTETLELTEPKRKKHRPVSTRAARTIRSGLDAGKGSARLHAQHPPTFPGILHLTDTNDLWHRALRAAYKRWLPVFRAEHEAGREEREARNAHARKLARERIEADAAREDRMRTISTAGFVAELQGHGRGSVYLMGRDVSRAVRGFTLTTEVGQPDRVELELVLAKVTRIESKQPEVLIPSSTRDLLTAVGWTPPEPPSV